MADADPTVSTLIAILINTLSAIARGIYRIPWTWLAVSLFRIVLWPLRMILIPLSFVANVLLTVFAPALYILSYFLSWLDAIAGFFASLEPLYIFFGAAAAVGIVAGIVVGVSSSLVTFYLGMQGDDEIIPRRSKQKYLSDSSMRFGDSSSTELEWQWLESPSQRRRPAAGLLSQTIHEDDDSEY